MQNIFMIEIINKFKLIKSKKYITAINHNNNAIGLTFEKMIGKKEDNFSVPDFYNIEIKCKRDTSNYPITLLSAEPDGDIMLENERLRLTYGIQDKDYPNKMIFSLRINTNNKNHYNHHYFILHCSDQKQKIFLYIYNYKHELIDTKTSWSYDYLKKRLFQKMPNLVLVKAKVKKNIESELFFFYQLKTFEFVSFNNFISLIKKGKIIVEFNVRVHKGNYRTGETKNCGTNFRILEEDLPFLFEKSNIIK